MDGKSAQIKLVCLALASILILCTVFITGAIWHFPLDYSDEQEVPLIELAIPPFASILGQAAAHLNNPGRVVISTNNMALLSLLIWGPSILFIFLFTILTVTFYVANVPGSQAVFTLRSYRSWLTLLLSIFTASVPVVSAMVFRKKA